MYYTKNRGWHKDSRRHSLARKGIKTAKGKPRFHAKGRYSFNFIDYEDPQSMFFGFWKANIENDYSNFDFDEAFKEGMKTVKFWGSQVPIDIYKLFTEEYGYDSIFGDPRLDEWIEDRGMTRREAISEDHGIMNRDLEMADLYNRLENPPKDIQGKTYLMDELIHTTHVTGSIWQDDIGKEIDVEKLRKEFDNYYTGVRRFR